MNFHECVEKYIFTQFKLHIDQHYWINQHKYVETCAEFIVFIQHQLLDLSI